MSDADQQADNCLSALGELEDSWQAAVDRALWVRDEQLTRAQRAISSLQHRYRQQESLLRLREEETELLKQSLSELNVKLDSAHSDIASLLEENQRQMEEKSLKHKEELEMSRSEMEALRARHQESIKELTAGVRETLEQLETQLETAKANENTYKKQMVELEKVNSKNEKHLHDWNRVSEQMCTELSEVKNKLSNSKYANNKIREEMSLWKKYCEKVEEERKTLKREIELERKVLKTLSQVETILKGDRQHRNMILEAMNSFGDKIMNEIVQKSIFWKPKSGLVSVESQTELTKDDVSEKNWEENEIIILRQKEIQLEEELKKAEMDVDNLTQQNITLREVIKGMKREREHWEKEKEQIEEEARVTKLEESVRLLKHNLTHEQKDVCVWSALQDVKKEVSNLKNKTLHKATKNG